MKEREGSGAGSVREAPSAVVHVPFLVMCEVRELHDTEACVRFRHVDEVDRVREGKSEDVTESCSDETVEGKVSLEGPLCFRRPVEDLGYELDLDNFEFGRSRGTPSS